MLKKYKKFLLIIIILLIGLILFNALNFYKLIINLTKKETINNEKVAIIEKENYIDSHYVDIAINYDEKKEKVIVLEILDISRELLNGQVNFILCKRNDLYDEYYQVQRIDSKYITTSKSSNKIYFHLNNIEKNEMYRVYIWKNIDNNSNDNFYIKYNIKVKDMHNDIKKDTSLNECDNLIIPPELDNGLIPVYIEEDGDVITTTENDKWYNYCEKRWANAILVSKKNRNKYLNNNNIFVNPDDILAYFVWIPRFSYKLWTIDFEKDKFGKEQEITIKFIDNKTKDNGKKENEWFTHPAFSFGNKELSGIWVGKFEITGKIDLPTILPNKTPIVNVNLKNYFNASLLFSGGETINNEVIYYGSNYYGLEKTTSSHLIKNSEWGAVTYLSNSVYGINDKIAINNYFNETNLTGCGSSSQDEVDNQCNIFYGNSKEYPQSSTGNITGVFDLSGGTGEYVMARLDEDNNLSGIDDLFFNNKNNYKFYDLYPKNIFDKSFYENISQCNLEICGGHALYETYNWYMTIHNFVDKKQNFIKRGCGNFSGSAATQYCMGYATGEAGAGTSSRVVLSITK